MTTPTPTLSPLPTPSSSRRTSTSSPIRSHSPSPARQAPAQRERRNRTALRDYYGLKANHPSPNANPTHLPNTTNSLGIVGEDGEIHGGEGGGGGGKWGDGEVKEGEMDKEGFDAEAYVKGVLGREGLEGVLRIEGALVGEIKSLDGERKALVYDNYSKLITATDTIRKMRLNMDPLAPTTSTLSPAVAHIADTASTLASSLRKRQKGSMGVGDGGGVRGGGSGGGEGGGRRWEERKRQKRTVKWVLDAPRRLQEQVDMANKEAAEKEWGEVKRLLERWRGVEGVEEVKGACERVLAAA